MQMAQEMSGPGVSPGVMPGDTGVMFSMQSVFASEEYPESAFGAFQDFVDVRINGQQVQLSVGDGDVDPNNLNAGANDNRFIDNTSDQYNTELDGFTVTLTLKIAVNAGQTDPIRIGIADVNVSNYDSTRIIAVGSIKGSVLVIDDETKLDPLGSRTRDALAMKHPRQPDDHAYQRASGQPWGYRHAEQRPDGATERGRRCASYRAA